MTDYSLVLSMHYPGSEWSMADETYESLMWYSETTKPAKQELDSLWQSVEVEIENQKIDSLRKAAYQQTSDPLFFKWQSGEATKDDWLAAREAVREQYPD